MTVTARREIVFVDDDDDEYLFLKEAIDDSGIACALSWVRDGIELMDHLRNHQKAACSPVILLDLNMPKSNGCEILKELKSDPKLKKIPVIVFTGSGTPQDVELCYDFGASSYIVKTAMPHEVYKTVLDYWCKTVVLPKPAVPA